MLQAALRYGIYAGIIGVVLFLFSLLGLKNLSFHAKEIAGYLAIAIALLTIYFGIKHIRNKQNGGVLSFKNALYYGCVIAAVAGIFVGIADVFYVTVIHPGYTQEYLQYLNESVKNSSRTPEQIEKLIQDNTKRIESYTPFSYFTTRFGTVVLMGALESLLFAALLKRKSASQ